MKQLFVNQSQSTSDVIKDFHPYYLLTLSNDNRFYPYLNFDKTTFLKYYEESTKQRKIVKPSNKKYAVMLSEINKRDQKYRKEKKL